MKKALAWITCFCAFHFSLAQSLFSLNDTVFATGSCYRAQGTIFQPGTAALDPHCFPTLDSVAALMTAHPGMKLQIGVHCDSRTPDYKIDLTRPRAQSIRNYLLGKQIAPERLEAFGYGKTRPLITDATIAVFKTKEEMELAYRQNRRVEFRIIALE